MYTTTTATTGNTIFTTTWTVTTYPMQKKQPERPKYIPTVEVDVMSDLTLAWWRVSGYRNDCGESVDKKYDKKGWWGLTMTNISDHEDCEIRRWVKQQNPDMIHKTKKDWDCGDEPNVVKFIGSYRDYCYNIWCETEDMMLDLVRLLKSFSPRTKVLLVKNPKAAKQFLKGTNFKIIEGSEITALGLTDEIDEVDETLIRLAAV